MRMTVPHGEGNAPVERIYCKPQNALRNKKTCKSTGFPRKTEIQHLAVGPLPGSSNDLFGLTGGSGAGPVMSPPSQRVHVLPGQAR